MDERQRRQFHFSWVYFLLALGLMLGLQYLISPERRARRIPYSAFIEAVKAGKVARAEIRSTEIWATLAKGKGKGAAGSKAREAKGKGGASAAAGASQRGAAGPQGEKKPGKAPGAAELLRALATAPLPLVIVERIPGVEEDDLIDLLEKHGVTFSGRVDRTPWWQPLLAWVLPLGLIFLFYARMLPRVGGGVGPMSFGRSRVKIYDQNEKSPVNFDDVAGVDEAEQELMEVVDFLKNPEKYRSLGARIPKGVLLVGPPGTGKTLLARAVAGEAGVPFFSIAGSEFVEMFVGVGAARMRDMFEQAKQRAPCIVFIDEIDTIGKSRGGLGAMATHDEREQTLNQLLVEMDGFDATTGVVIMAATNRPEVLDPALVRPGRFDRQVVVDRPDLDGRRAILEVHARKVELGDDVDLDLIARRTPGMVGADLANLVNEAALAAARRGAKRVGQQDFEEALDRIQLGLKKRGRAMSEEEKRRVAYHEGGHTLVALSLPHADPVHRVSIIPRSIGALGVTLQLPTEDRYLLTVEELLDRIAVMLGGRAAEEIVFGDVSTGAQNDLERVSETARQMVTRFGMSERLGAITLGRPLGGQFLGGPFAGAEERNYSEETARAIDAEVRRIADEQYRRAVEILTERRSALEAIARALLEKETVERAELLEIVGQAAPAGEGAKGA